VMFYNVALRHFWHRMKTILHRGNDDFEQMKYEDDFQDPLGHQIVKKNSKPNLVFKNFTKSGKAEIFFRNF